MIAMLTCALDAMGMSPLPTREPGSGSLGGQLRPILLNARNSWICPTAEVLLFLADRAQHVAEVIRPALESGRIVLCDRYSDSTMAYQGYGRGINLDDLEMADRLATGGLEPDATILLDLPPEDGLSRAWARNDREGITVTEGRFDTETRAFHNRVRDGFLALARRFPKRITVVDASADPETVFQRCLKSLGLDH